MKRAETLIDAVLESRRLLPVAQSMKPTERGVVFKGVGTADPMNLNPITDLHTKLNVQPSDRNPQGGSYQALRWNPKFQRRSQRIPNTIVPSAVNLETNAMLVGRPSGKSDELAGFLTDVPTDSMRKQRSTILGHHELGLYYSQHPRTQSILRAVAQHKGEDPHPEVKRESNRLHKHIVRSAVKAGIFATVDHEVDHPEHPKGSGKKIKVKVLTPGPNFHEYHRRSYLGVTGHDSYEHATLGADASQRGEAMTKHLNMLADAVRLQQVNTKKPNLDGTHMLVKNSADAFAINLDTAYRNAARLLPSRIFKRIK